VHDKKRKYKTCKRYDVPGHVHELTFSCFRNQPLLTERRRCLWLAEAIEAARQKHVFLLWGWVFMPTHVHLIIWPTMENYSISKILQSIKQPVGRKEITYLKNKHDPELECLETGQAKPKYRFWQDGGGFDRNITDSDILRAALEYIHLNPVRKNLVETSTDWEWSSARDWAGLDCDILEVDKDSFDPGM